MAFSSGFDTSIDTTIDEGSIAGFYLGVKKIPCVISSPLRNDKHPSLSIYSPDGVHVCYIDFATKESGRLYGLLSKIWNLDYVDTIKRINKEMLNGINDVSIKKNKKPSISMVKSNINIECKTRPWRDYDISYWNEYGITKEQLEYADVYPISKIIRIQDGHRSVFDADKYAYAYIERKEGNITIKIYQPFNTRGYKWMSKHDKSVISLWTKIPEHGDIVCICSSMKDALCLWSNTSIPSIAIQGEGYPISNTARNELKSRFKNVCVMLDNDKPGIEDAKKLCKETGFINVVLPQFEGGKDISDFYKYIKDKDKFKTTLIKLFSDEIRKVI
jgi:hypothetical protein